MFVYCGTLTLLGQEPAGFGGALGEDLSQFCCSAFLTSQETIPGKPHCTAVLLTSTRTPASSSILLDASTSKGTQQCCSDMALGWETRRKSHHKPFLTAGVE